ncbi:MAG: hypothetical protein J7M30_01660 [Deltaproteobacteria bacterium]|nr:hypothetical protein [Deltaproteobacteria bacterium]
MAEIKSTLDIIMEKTRDMTMTDEEKRELKRREMAGKFKGLVQKFLDNIIDLDRLKVEAAALGEGHEDMFRRVSMQETMGRIGPEGDNEPVLKILESTTGMDTGPIREFITDFERKLEKERAVHENGLKKRLKKKGISGSAVIPNLDADSQWRDYVSKLNKTFRKEVAGLVD